MISNKISTLLLKEALADLEGIMPEFEPSGDRQHPAWETITRIKDYLIEDESLSLLRDALKVLNMVPNKVYNGTDFESYQLAGRIQDYLEGK